MPLFYLFWNIATFLIYPAVIGAVFLYLYPALFGCNFPAPTKVEQEQCIVDKNEFRNVTVAEVAPFRLLVYADPQLEGDSSLPLAEDPTFPNLYRLWTGNLTSNGTLPIAVAKTLGAFVTKDIPLLLSSFLKRIDLPGNDFYLAHNYRTLNWWLKPTHITVLGDLIGSQWVSDKEFERRGRRFWKRVFKNAQRVEDEITNASDASEVLGEDTTWRRRLIAIAGNHDIGYAGDLDEHRMTRFERVFGKANWARTFQLPSSEPDMSFTSSSATVVNPFARQPLPREIRLVVLNSMNLDGPVLDSDLQMSTYSFINDELIVPAREPGTPTTFTILLTHIPLHKEAGICSDSPYIAYNDSRVSEQNHLSTGSSRNMLEGIFGLSTNPRAPAGGMGRHGVILNGHDHVGCDVYHYLDRGNTASFDEWTANASADPFWATTQWSNASWAAKDSTLPGIREITVRSMMGSYNGNAGMLSAWFDETDGEWRFAYATCPLGAQHIWWAVHALILVTVGCFVLAFVTLIWSACEDWRQEARSRRTVVTKEVHAKTE